MILGSVCISKIELYKYKWNTLAKSQHVTCFQKPNGFTTKCRGSSLEESAMGPGNFTTKCLGFSRLFFNLVSIFIHGPRYFSLQNALPAKVEVGPDLFTRWPHYKMTYENPFCSGLKATHSVWEIRWGILFILFHPFSIFVILGLSSLHHVQIHWFQKKMLSITKTPEKGVWAAFIYKMFCWTPFCHWLQNAVRKVMGNV